ncbi:hypothetical protein NIES932_24220 [Raphidiopsis curvata NIES-932]|nr:hypothetical protein NIES932_24220 [Raphidiopsis curvata NIES-932]
MKNFLARNTYIGLVEYSEGGLKDAIALMNWLSIQEYEMLMEYSEGGLKNAIALMNWLSIRISNIGG